MEIINNQKKYTYYFEDTLSSDLNESLVGRKGLSLFKMHESDVPVPDFFVISSSLFDEYILKVMNRKDILDKGKNVEKRDFHEAMKKEDFSAEVIEEIKTQYTKLSGFVDTWVSVRASVVMPSSPEVSFSGVFDTKLNVRGLDHIVRSIKEIFSDMFSDDVLKYCVNERVELADVKLAVVVQKMVQAEISGVCFTVDPITQDSNRMSIEAVYGLGDVISNGEITPDTYILNKRDLAIVEKHIAPQEWMKIRTLNSNALEATEKIQISPNWSHKQKLEDKKMSDVAKISLILEESYGSAQDVEWVYGNGHVWALQTKHSYGQVHTVNSLDFGYFSLVSDSLFKVVNEIIARKSDVENLSQKIINDSAKLVIKSQNEAPKPVEIKEKISEEEFALSGIGASYGVATGKVRVVDTPYDIVAKNEIALMKKYSKDLYPALLNTAGVITEIGGLTSDISITCRELNIPAVVGASGASAMIKGGEEVKIDGNSGNVYRIKTKEAQQQVVAQEIAQKLEVLNTTPSPAQPSPVQAPIAAPSVPVVDEKPKASKDFSIVHTATKVFTSNTSESSNYVNADGVAVISLDKLMIEDGRHPLAYVADGKYREYAEKIAKKIDEIAYNCSPNEVIVSIGSETLSSFRSLTCGKDQEGKEANGNSFGVTRYLNNKKLLETALKIVKRVRNIHHNRNVSLALHSPLNGQNMREIKKEVNAIGLRRTNTFNIYAVIESPSEVLLLEDILAADIDGVILNTPMIAKLMQGISFDDTTTHYDLLTGGVQKVLEDVIRAVRANQNRSIVVTQDDKALIKLCIKQGVYGVIVSDMPIADSKTLISSEESKLLLSR